MPSTQTFTLPAGTICWRGGIPFMLMNATLIECHPDNWPLIRDGFQSSTTVDGQTILCSQALDSLEEPMLDHADFFSRTTACTKGQGI